MGIATLGLLVALSGQATPDCPACEQAQQLVTAGDTTAAIEVLRAETQRQPKSAEAWGNLGLLLTHTAPSLERDFAQRLEAEKALNQAIQLEPRNPRWLYGLALLKRKQGQRRDAERLFDRALSVSEGGGVELSDRELARLYAERGRLLEEQAMDFEGFIAMGDRIVEVNVADCIELGPFCLNFVSPEAFHEGLFAVAPADNLARRHRIQMREMFEKAFELDPSLDAAARGLLADLARRNEWRQYIEVAADHSRAAADDGWTDVFLAAGYFRMNHPVLAEDLFESGLASLDPDEQYILNDVTSIVSSAMEEQYLSAAGDRREDIRDYLWKVSNPFYLSDVNERRLEHLTRVALAELWFGVPQTGTRGYETDRGIVLIRYGEPKHIRQLPRDEVYETSPDFVSEENPMGLFVAEPGSGRWILWTYDTSIPSFVFEKGLRSRTARHGIQTQSRQFVEDMRVQRPSTFDLPDVLPLRHQAVRFKGTERAIEADLFAVLPADTLAAEQEVHGKAGIFFTPPSSRHDLVRIESPITFEDRTRILTFRVPLNPGVYSYSLEAATDDGRIRARSRTAIQVPDLGRGFSASDILVGHHIEPIREPVTSRHDMRMYPSGDLTFEQEAPLALYFELYNLSFDEDDTGRFRITLEVEDQHERTVGRSIVRRLAEMIGRTEEGQPITWERTVTGPLDRVPEWFTVTLGPERPGVYRVRIRAEDLLSGTTTETTRLFEIVAPKPEPDPG